MSNFLEIINNLHAKRSTVIYSGLENIQKL